MRRRPVRIPLIFSRKPDDQELLALIYALPPGVRNKTLKTLLLRLLRRKQKEPDDLIHPPPRSKPGPRQSGTTHMVTPDLEEMHGFLSNL